MQTARREQFQEVLQWLARGRADARAYGPRVAALAPRARRSFFQRTPEALSVGTLEHLLDIAHDELDGDPRNARELVNFVLEYVDAVPGPAASPVPLLLFRARAWKEHANVLRLKDPRAALEAVRRAAAILEGNGACFPELANVRQLEAMIRHELGDTAAALSIVRESAEVFQQERDAARFVQARMFEGIFLFKTDPRAAAGVFEGLLPEAARLRDPRELARLCNNLWQCALVLEDDDLAHRYYARAVELFAEVGMEAETPRLGWGYARHLARRGNMTLALRKFSSARDEFVARELLIDAALVSLDIVDLLHAAGRVQEARELAATLVATFSTAGIAASARKALAFLRDRSARPAFASRDIRAVREHLERLELQPDREFLSPRA